MANSKARENYYASYKAQNRWRSNREAKLLRQLKLNPNNAEQINQAIANIKYRRKTPVVRQWPASVRRAAQLIREFSGRCDPKCFSSNQKLAEQTIMTTWRTHNEGSVPQGKVDFSLGARLHGIR